MSRRPAIRNRGLSLVELLLGLAIGALLLAPLLPMLQTSGTAARVTDDQTTIERDADFALERIAARIRATSASASLTGSSSNWFAPVSYVISNGSLVEHQGGSPDLVLADGVTDFQLNAPTVDTGRQIVQVSLTLARGDASTTANETVRVGGMQ